MNKLRYIAIGTVLCLVIIVGVAYFVFTPIERSGKNAVTIDVVPDDAIVSIDDKRVKRGINYLEPGTYEVRASREGFEDYTRTIRIHPYTKSYGIILNPNSEEGRKWQEENPDAMYRVEIINDLAVKESGKAFHERNPIAAKLPYKNILYSIGTRIDPSDPSELSIIIEIDAPEGYRQSALFRIRQLGYDPTDFNINFRDYENPFPL